MKFIAIVLAVLIERFWPQVQDVRKMDMFQRYIRAMRLFLGDSAAFDGVVGAVVALLPAIIVIAWLQVVLSKGLLLLFGLVFAVVALVASIGPRDLLTLMKSYVEAVRRGDAVTAHERAGRLLGRAPPDDEAQRHRAVVRSLFSGVNDWFPCAVFWFAWFGPVGAVTFRLLALMKDFAAREQPDSGFARGARSLYDLAIWIPARITVLAYAFIGNFDDTVRAWRSAAKVDASFGNSQAVLLAAGLGAAQLDRDDRAITVTDLQVCVALLRRTVIVWLVLFALATLFGLLR